MTGVVMAHSQELAGMLAGRISRKIVAAELQDKLVVDSYAGASCFRKLDQSPTFRAGLDSGSARDLG